MEVGSVYGAPRIQQEHCGHARIHDALIIHWVAVAILVISQFTIIPLLVILIADTHQASGLSVRSDVALTGTNITIVFKDLPKLLP